MRRLSILGLLPMLLLALAGCGTKAADAATVVRSTPAKTTDAKTARVAMTFTGASGGSDVTGDGVVDIAANRADLTLNVAQAGLGQTHVLLAGTNLFVQLPAQLQSEI